MCVFSLDSSGPTASGRSFVLLCIGMRIPVRSCQGTECSAWSLLGRDGCDLTVILADSIKHLVVLQPHPECQHVWVHNHFVHA